MPISADAMRRLEADRDREILAEIRGRPINHDTADGGQLRLDGGELPAIDASVPVKSPRKLEPLGLASLETDEERALPASQRPLPSELARRAAARGAELRESDRQKAGASLLEKAAAHNPRRK